MNPILRADFCAIDHYVHKKTTPLDIPIFVAIGMQEDISYEEGMAWHMESTRQIEVSHFPGGHFFIHENSQNIASFIINAVTESKNILN